MFPIRDENPTIRSSVATLFIIGLNVAAWIFIQGLGSHDILAQSVCKFGAISGELLGKIAPGTEVPLGPSLICVIDGNPNWLTVITHIFMHGGWLHIIGNMWFLYVFGDNVEDAMGSLRFIAFYLLCGLAAFAAQMLSNPASAVPMVGASGAISGVLGAYVLLYPKAPVHVLVFLGIFITRVVVPAYFMLGFWFIIQFISGLYSFGSESGGVAFWAHVGGFACGIVLIKVFCRSDRLEACKQKRGSTNRLMERLTD
jgi:membrane associated rhomboid family serine protease